MIEELVKRIVELEKRVAALETVEEETRPAITGSKAGNTALTNLLIALEQYGYIEDNTT